MRIQFDSATQFFWTASFTSSYSFKIPSISVKNYFRLYFYIKINKFLGTNLAVDLWRLNKFVSWGLIWCGGEFCMTLFFSIVHSIPSRKNASQGLNLFWKLDRSHGQRLNGTLSFWREATFAGLWKPTCFSHQHVFRRLSSTVCTVLGNPANRIYATFPSFFFFVWHQTVQREGIRRFIGPRIGYYIDYFVLTSEIINHYNCLSRNRSGVFIVNSEIFHTFLYCFYCWFWTSKC